MPFTEDNEENMNIMLDDFPTLTPEDIEDNIELIESYYSENLTYLVEDKLANEAQEITTVSSVSLKTSQNQKTFSDDDQTWYDLYVERIWQVALDGDRPETVNYVFGTSFTNDSFNKTLGRYALNKSGIYAKLFSKIAYGSYNEGDTRRDAFRHIYWQGACAKYYFSNSKSKKEKFAELVGYANELVGYYNQIDAGSTKEAARSHVLNSPATWMDLHNNAIGRSIWDAWSKPLVLQFKVPYWKGWSLKWKTISVTVGVVDILNSVLNVETGVRIITKAKYHQYKDNTNGTILDIYSTSANKTKNLETLIYNIKRTSASDPVYISDFIGE